MEKKPLVVIAGPTAIGKTSLSIELAKGIDGEIISADSMQVYKGMDIGSAKITKEEMEGVPHYLIDILEPTEDFNVHLFQKLSKNAMIKIYNNNHIPIIVGGTGFYIQAVAYDIDFCDEDDNADFKERLSIIEKNEGSEALFNMLKEVDPKSAKEIHPNNTKRVIRALMFNKTTGESIFEHNKAQRKKESPYNLYYYVLIDDRDLVYERINNRVDKMIKMGFIDEVKRLKSLGVNGEMTSAKGLGYKEIYSYLDGEISLERAVYLIKQNTRHFAKRQITWFKREKDVRWINKSDYKDEREILEHIKEQVTNG